jgi:hypothetical protein
MARWCDDFLAHVRDARKTLDSAIAYARTKEEEAYSIADSVARLERLTGRSGNTPDVMARADEALDLFREIESGDTYAWARGYLRDFATLQAAAHASGEFAVAQGADVADLTCAHDMTWVQATRALAYSKAHLERARARFVRWCDAHDRAELIPST